jgi:hypothetical protein
MNEPEAKAGETRPQRDPLFTLLRINGLAGAALGVLFVCGALALDLGHLRRLIGFSTDGTIALALLLAGSIITFASVAMGSAIMMIRDKVTNRHSGGTPEFSDLAPAPLRAAMPRRPQRS